MCRCPYCFILHSGLLNIELNVVQSSFKSKTTDLSLTEILLGWREFIVMIWSYRFVSAQMLMGLIPAHHLTSSASLLSFDTNYMPMCVVLCYRPACRTWEGLIRDLRKLKKTIFAQYMRTRQTFRIIQMWIILHTNLTLNCLCGSLF